MASGKQGNSEGIFQGSNTGANCGLADPYGLRRPVKSAVSSYSQKGFNLVDFHRSISPSPTALQRKL